MPCVMIEKHEKWMTWIFKINKNNFELSKNATRCQNIICY